MTNGRLLPWDSHFFGVRVGRFDTPALRPAVLRDAEAWAEANGVECLYVLADLPLAGHWPDYLPVDERVTLRARPCRAREPLSVRYATEADIQSLRALAAANHHGTRFHVDRRLAPHASRLYEIWIEQSIRDEGIVVFVPQHTEVLGYISCLADGSTGHIGLMGVSAAARGRGFGRALVRAALDWCAQAALPGMEVVTQGTNIAALRLYESCGFEIVRQQYWYHRWFPRTS